MRQAAVAGVAWAAAAVVVVALIAIGIVFRDGVVRAWPPTASFYAAIGLPVNPTGLVIEQVRAEPSLQQGHAALTVSGVIRNVVDRAVIAPPLRISLAQRAGQAGRRPDRLPRQRAHPARRDAAFPDLDLRPTLFGGEPAGGLRARRPPRRADGARARAGRVRADATQLHAAG